MTDPFAHDNDNETRSPRGLPDPPTRFIEIAVAATLAAALITGGAFTYATMDGPLPGSGPAAGKSGSSGDDAVARPPSFRGTYQD